MKGARIVGGLLALATLTGATACGSSAKPVSASSMTAERPSDILTPLLQQALPDVPGKTFTSATVDFPPNAKAVPHRHGQAFIYAYVIEGAIRSQLEGQAVMTYQQGQGWVELPGSHHVAAENASATQPAKLLTVFVANTDDPLKTDDPH
ncbi:cupin domain-containing protein [Kibdelosporangium philippinense]|uniref:Cupin domain-containing protein n=1 Tax=Kibdelosporangium philippinense TaxID=211113 RepID=A0ABS8ZYH3_9PSEU|nr:cupin domain-containing protein [Kibdelosporangium philippinense]MCE7011172.1 cupin domain-containing protein [Kibdelosporangium philippinense]